MVGEAVLAVRDLADLGARQLLGIIVQLVNVAQHHGRPMALEQVGVTALAGDAGGDLRSQVAGHHVGHAHVEGDQLPQPLHVAPGLDELQERQSQALLIDLDRAQRIAARHDAAEAWWATVVAQPTTRASWKIGLTI